MPNSLIHESSPYLLQHAHNPVDWFAWGTEALGIAQEQDKPILVSIGYAACHWCHVMERESFEDPQIAKLMNDLFVNIKIDREERPDLDLIYMDAVVALTGHGGWPLNCFLLPDGRPFYGGTYFPPKSGYGKPDWQSVLLAVATAFVEKRPELEKQANQLTYHLLTQDQQFVQPVVEGLLSTENLFDQELPTQIFERLQRNFDTQHGGFGRAPKFPSTMNLQYLLHFYEQHPQHTDALRHALFSIQKMSAGGIYDHIGGAFARYATDDHWFAPHFEKMLYDNALLITLLAHAHKITNDDDICNTIKQTLQWVEREMTSEEGGFYAAQDADSEGEEGKFYVWKKEELDRLLQDDAPIFQAFYGIKTDGNWEHGNNILHQTSTIEQLAQRIGYEPDELQRTLRQCKLKLFAQRQKRPKPLLDDKILLSWNALMTTAYCHAYHAIGKQSYADIATKNAHFMLNAFRQNPNTQTPESYALLRSYKNKKTRHQACLDDYALLIEALLHVYTLHFDLQWLEHADRLCQYVQQHFFAPNSPFFFYTDVTQNDIIGRKKDLYDNATPSGNATMANNLLQLAIYTNQYTYRQQAEQMLKSMENTIVKYPSAFGKWASTLLSRIYPIHEIGIVGKDAICFAKEIQKKNIPNTIVMACSSSNEHYPLLDKPLVNGKTMIYLCKNNECMMPVDNLEEFYKIIYPK